MDLLVCRKKDASLFYHPRRQKLRNTDESHKKVGCISTSRRVSQQHHRLPGDNDLPIAVAVKQRPDMVGGMYMADGD